MAQPASSGSAQGAIEALLREELAVADRAVASNGPILRHLLRNDDNSIFSDEIVARVRGMFHDVARQLVAALGEAAGHADPQEWSFSSTEGLARVLAENGAFLSHFHALALEWQLTERLQSRLGLDPVLPPLLQARIADADPEVSATAMNLLAAQARFGQAERRMQLPLGELPGDLFHIALVTMRTFVGDDAGGDGYALVAERTLRARFDEERGRLGLLRRVLRATGTEAVQALSVEQAGVALFLTALATGSGQTREAATLSTCEVQLPRLALGLSACGLRAEAIAAQFLALHPEVSLPDGFAALGPDGAAAILAAATGH
ncbi:hypothetical protein [Novosphingobium cyanobacteriorum]|uniref:DUF2336 domain-containing protein n=1 Tax=Novosphingobium cyanobacteriorum TaxID=3024215 RepID=A0ABT6CJU5_9SPHN|nr:hypothetical protein [Novosphingobium cyanobacteriorum]MDF8334077.1 hypothetical protein [Novosphingobium cyanobacteriorum]